MLRQFKMIRFIRKNQLKWVDYDEVKLSSMQYAIISGRRASCM